MGTMQACEKHSENIPQVVFTFVNIPSMPLFLSWLDSSNLFWGRDSIWGGELTST